ncbi:MAG: hypothetical protein ACERLM_05175, partial [Acidimicrobiales bacterium]
LDAPPPGTFNYSDTREYAPTEAIDLLNGVLVTKGYDPAFGARPLKRVIQREIGDRLAMALLDGTVLEGAEVTVDGEGDEIVLR